MDSSIKSRDDYLFPVPKNGTTKVMGFPAISTEKSGQKVGGWRGGHYK
jgi:hypothetical protein